MYHCLIHLRLKHARRTAAQLLLRGVPITQRPAHQALLNFFVRMMLAAERAEFFHFKPLRCGFLVLHARIVLALAIGALKSDLFSRHTLLPIPALTDRA